MAKVMLVQPWNYHDEGVAEQDLSKQWRNGPYALLLLATQLKRHGHDAQVVDMIRDLVVCRGDVDACLQCLTDQIQDFTPDIIGFGFFSIHYFEVKIALNHARKACKSIGIKPLFIAGGIHASTEPKGTIDDLGFDYAFKGEADLGILELANGTRPESVNGVVARTTLTPGCGEEVKPLDSLPFPDWSLCDHEFYSTPSWARMGFRKTSSLDLIMGRGCVYKCAFCAYNALSAVRFYSPEYLVEQMEYMHREYGVSGLYFTDSTIGNNRKVLRAMCEEIIRRGTQDRVEWYANIRPNQVNEEILRLMRAAGCEYLFYGFESNSQYVLDLMSKSCRIEFNHKAAELHNRLRFPYHASMLLGYPGEREEDIQQTLAFLRDAKPPSIGINWYVPLPGSPDYDKLKAEGVIDTDDPHEWRRIGEVNHCRVYADVPENRFRELFKEAERLAYVELPRRSRAAWGCLAPPQCEVTEETQAATNTDLPSGETSQCTCGSNNTIKDKRSRATYGASSAA